MKKYILTKLGTERVAKLKMLKDLADDFGLDITDGDEPEMITDTIYAEMLTDNYDKFVEEYDTAEEINRKISALITEGYIKETK